MDIHQKTAGRNQTVRQLSKAGFPKGGRPPGSKAKIPEGYVGVDGLAEMLGLDPLSIRKKKKEDLPPRAAWCGKRALWSVEVVVAWQKEHDGASQAQVLRPAAPPPASSVWNFADQISISTPPTDKAKAKRKPGRPRNKAKT